MRFLGNAPFRDRAEGQDRDEYLKELTRLNSAYLLDVQSTVNYNARTSEFSWDWHMVPNGYYLIQVADITKNIKACECRTFTGTCSIMMWISGARGLRVMEWDIGTGTPPWSLACSSTVFRAQATAYNDMLVGDTLLVIVGSASAVTSIAVTFRTG